MPPAAVTQLVECPAVNRIVTGSSPVGGVNPLLLEKENFNPGISPPSP